MYLSGGTAGIWQANWYLVGPDHGRECVIIDPGQDSARAIRQALADDRREPVAVLATHGHIDHIADAAGLADEYGIPLHIHSLDRPFLTNPIAALFPAMGLLLAQAFPQPFREPADVREYQMEEESGRGAVGIGGLDFQLRHAPGHTPGSTLLVVAEDPAAPVVFSGDVVFAGSIGRTDFAVGDPAAMSRSLRDQVLTLPGQALLLPGHGPASDVSRERRSNPFLRGGT
ncbi:MAG: MBL fold metallo-hydrolase [Bifidobacteriaceae bacterium]|jgi:glyoxylase-like metal-dependent hydrolase (beta-lactamase superfamily II)|nr:MBL fold metallo-hydrolase [Bifidobacteriaceae bacterium]